MEITDAPSRSINLWLEPKLKHAPAVYDRLDAIQKEVENLEIRRTRNNATAEKFRKCLRAICLDLFDAYIADVEMLVGVPRDNNILSSKDKSHGFPDFVAARPFKDALNGLIATKYIEQVSLGNESSGQRSRVVGTKQLVDKVGVGELCPKHLIDTSDPIILRVGPKRSKKRQGFVETEQTKKWRSNLNCINDLLDQYRITLDLNQTQVREMEKLRSQNAKQEALQNKMPFDYQRVNTGRVRLYRVFNSPDWSQGGRFYGGWWQSIPGGLRSNIKINDKLTCEYDFSSIHPHLLYQKIGRPLPEGCDPYGAVFDGKHRKAVKRAFNAMLNAKKLPNPVPEFSKQETGLTWKQFTNAIIDYHKPLKSFMNSGEGVILQKWDSDIAEAIMLKFVEMRQPCLPIHDSFITYKTLESELPDIMSVAVKNVAGSFVPAQKAYSAECTPKNIGLVTDDIIDLLNEQKDIDQ